MKELGIYIHVPYCVKKCRYCDFCSHIPENNSEVAGYFEQIRLEIMKAAFVYRNEYYVDTIFFGGGTPSLVPAGELARTLSCIRQNWRVAGDAEISLEANPGTISEEKIDCYLKAGFNRISIGIQSFNDDILKNLGRIHDYNGAWKAVELARSFKNFNIDLMFGVPGQTADIWKETVSEAISLKPNHISFYSLQLEEGTDMFDDYRAGRIELPKWEENREMYHMAVNMLRNAGYHHYEISNAALPGYECCHNLKYWQMKPYLGFGESAWSYIDGVRKSAYHEEAHNTADKKGDFIFTELRLVDGFPLKEYEEMFGISFTEEYKETVYELIEEGLLEIQDERCRFTEKGLDFTNPVMERLLNYE